MKHSENFTENAKNTQSFEMADDELDVITGGSYAGVTPNPTTIHTEFNVGDRVMYKAKTSATRPVIATGNGNIVYSTIQSIVPLRATGKTVKYVMENGDMVAEDELTKVD